MEHKYFKLTRFLPLLLLLIVLGTVVYNYQKRANFFRDSGGPAIRQLPPNASELTEGFTLYQSENGQTVVELKAKVRLGFKDNKSLFESVSARFFGKTGGRYDTIRSDRCQYDQEAEEITFFGNVVITLSNLTTAPSAATNAPEEEPTVIHVPQITYRKKGGSAETSDHVQFTRGRIHGECRGLSYASSRQLLRLRSAVEIFIDPAKPGDLPAHINAGSLDYRSAKFQAELHTNVTVRKGVHELRADTLTISMGAEHAVKQIEATGNVRCLSRDPSFQFEVDAPKLEAFFSADGRWPERILTDGKVQGWSLTPQLKRNLDADALEITMQPSSTRIDRMRAVGNVVGIFGSGNGAIAQEAKAGPGDRLVRSPEIQVHFRKAGNLVETVEALGPSSIEEFPQPPHQDRRRVSAQVITMVYASNANRVERINADQAVKVEVIPPQGGQKTSYSDHLVALVDRQTQQMTDLHQAGHFRYLSEDWQATAEEAHYDARLKLTRLEGHPRAEDARSQTTADLFEYYESEELVKARGHVRSVLYNNPGAKKEATPFASGAPVYASADNLDAKTKAATARYWQQAKLWQGDQVLRAGVITLYRTDRKLEAEGDVSTLLRLDEGARSPTPPTVPEKEKRQPTLVQANHLVYLDQLQTATYDGKVRLNDPMGVLTSNRLEVFLATENHQTTLQRLKAVGQVRIYQTNRTSSSDVAEYFRDEDKTVLTGGPPRIIDAVRGSTTGARLTMYRNSDSILVEGKSETRSYAKPSRVSQ